MAKKKAIEPKVKKQKKSDQTIFFLLLIIVAIIPILVQLAQVQLASPLNSMTAFDSGIKYETVSYYRFLFLSGVVAVLLAIFIYKIVREGFEISFDYTSLPLVILFLLILISGMFAEYKTISLYGLYNRHEGTMTYLIYLILFFIAANVSYAGKKAHWFLYALSPFVLVNIFLSGLSFYGVNVLKWPFITNLLVPISLHVDGSFGTGSIFNSTLGNRDYLSGFAGVLTITFLTGAILARKKGIKIWHICFSVLSFAILLTTFATSGFFTVLVLMPVVILFIFYSQQRKNRFFTFIITLLSFVLVFAALNYHNPAVWDKTVGFLLGQKSIAIQQQVTKSDQIDTKSVPIITNQKTGVLASENNTPNNVNAKSAWTLGSGRLYIWRKTIELAVKHPVLGYGLDTLAFYFPQEDTSKVSGIGGIDVIIDKPHSLYLDIAFGSGLMALTSFLALIGLHFWNYIKFFKRSLDNEKRIFLAVLFIAWSAYLVQGLFNDSIIGTAPVFWILFGVSISALREELKHTV